MALEVMGSTPTTHPIFTVRKDCDTEKSLIIKDFLCFIQRFFNSNSFAEKNAVFEVYRSRTGDFLMYLIFSILSNAVWKEQNSISNRRYKRRSILIHLNEKENG